MTEELRVARDPVLGRLQRAFWREEPTTDLAAVVRRATAGRAPGSVLAELFSGLPVRGDLGAQLALGRLSPREREVLWLATEGRTNHEIGRELLVSVHTVRTHLENILGKLQLQSKLEAVAFATDHALVDDVGGGQLYQLTDRLDDERVLAAVRQLPRDQRDVLLLGTLGGLTAPEMAEVLGTTTGAVKALRHRGLVNLSRMLDLRDPSRSHDPGT
jgi:DNA-binding CsgD family transcriptional regulator